MLLILSNSEDVTTDYLANRLTQTGLSVVRFDTDRTLDHSTFRYTIGSPELHIHDHCYTPTDFASVWYRRPERLKHALVDDSSEGKVTLEEWAEALEAFLAHIPAARWINYPSANVAASHKLEQLTTARRLGFTVPETLVTQDPSRLRAFFRRFAGKIIIKPMSTGYVERKQDRDSLIYTNPVTESQLDDLSTLPLCPTLFQERIEKRSDIRITIVDQELHAVELKAADPDGSQRCDIRRYNMSDVTYHPTSLPAEIAASIRMLVAHYGLRFAAIDMALTTTGGWVFFEINPNGQWAWLDLAGASDISSSFVRAFTVGTT
jgi:glutathione synthase/RimK-type ligase-like ATP-grasp enzyme